MSAAEHLNQQQFHTWADYVPHSANPNARTPDDVPGSGAMESYHIYKGSDAAASEASRDGSLGQFDSFHVENRDVPLSHVRYYNQQRVLRDHVESLAKVPAKELPPAWGQAQPDGSVTLIEGHHRAAAASRRGDTHVNMDVYGKWDKHTERPPGPVGKPW